MNKLTGKVAIVTGASKGIGAAIAKGLAAAGSAVAVNYSSSKEGADRTVTEIIEQGGKAIPIKADVGKAAEVSRLFEETEKALGSPSVLVNNAGVFVWYFAEEVFLKKNGKGGRTPWHQDTSYLPWDGMHWANALISFEPVPKLNALEMIRGSHRGIRYDGTDFKDPSDPTVPLHGGSALPRLPDIEAQRKADQNAYDIMSWATQPGDVLVMHPGMLHGGAPVDASFRDRHTLVLRFFGDDATFRPLPSHSDNLYTEAGILFVDQIGHLKEGDPFRSPFFKQLR